MTRCHSQSQVVPRESLFGSPSFNVQQRCTYVDKAICETYKNNIKRLIGDNSSGNLNEVRNRVRSKISGCIETLDAFNDNILRVNSKSEAEALEQMAIVTEKLQQRVAQRAPSGHNINFSRVDGIQRAEEDTGLPPSMFRYMSDFYIPSLRAKLRELNEYAELCGHIDSHGIQDAPSAARNTDSPSVIER